VGGAALLFGMMFWLFLTVAGAALYFLPTIVAVAAHRTNVAAIAVINVLLGWSFIGWVVALVMALSRDAQPVQVVQVHQQMGYAPGSYQQPSPPYGHTLNRPGSQIQRVDTQPTSGSQLSPSQQPDQPQ
jgi:hypothetical protein